MTIERPMFPPVNRRGFIAQSAIATAAIAISPVALAAPSADAEFVSLGAQFEPLVEKYYAAHAVWAPALTQAHAEMDEKYGTRADRGFRDTPEIHAAWEETCARLNVAVASEKLSAIHEEMEPIAHAINALPCTSIEVLRAKALVTLWEVSQVGAGDTEYSFDDAFPFQVLFCAVAEFCGIMPKIAATGYQLPELFHDDDDSDDQEEA